MPMKTKLLIAMFTALVATSAHAQSAWVNETEALIDQARAAKRSNASAAEATSQLLATGRDPAQVVQSVVRVYGNCDGLRQSVEAGTRAAPESAQAIVEAVNALPCMCTAESVWPHIRLDSRLRLEAPRMAVEVGSMAMCSAAAAEAAVRGAPDKASEILRGSVGAGRSGGSVLDSVGQVGAAPKSLASQENLTRDVQKADGCAVDTKIDDDFNPERRFQDRAAAGEVVQSRAENCDRNADLYIDGIAAAQTSNTAVVLRNDTDAAIDLDRGGYALEVYFAGSTVAGRKVALQGSINAGASYVVASPEAESSVLTAANFVSPSIRVSPGDAVVLRRGSAINDCRGVATATAVIANALGEGQGETWLKSVEQEYSSGRAAETVDRVGQTGAPVEAWQGSMTGKSMSIKRSNDTCMGDDQLAGAFAVQGGWQASDGVNASDLGGSEGRCAQRSADVVISQYANAAESYRAVELLNNSSGDVDFGAGGYLLEIYADGASQPTRTIALEGTVKAGEAFVIADEDAPAEIRERSRMISADLGQSRINAIALRKMATVSGRACEAAVLAIVRDIDAVPVGLVLQNPITPSRDPRADDQVDRNSGGILASPN